MDPCYQARRFVAVLVALVIVASAAPTAAQYMYLDANGDGVHDSADALASGSGTLDVWLDTGHDRDGTQATCAQDASAPFTINSYTFILRAANGTVLWSGFQNHITEFGLDAGGGSTSTEFWVGRASGSILPPGRYRLASVTVTAASGTPSIWIASKPENIDPTAITSFGCQCLGNDFDNTMKLGSDWFDADGVPYGAAGNHGPVLDPLTSMSLAEGTAAEQTLHATDADGQPLAFGSDNAPAWVAVTTTDPGSGSAAGLVRLTPGFSDAGVLLLYVLVSDGISQSGSTLPITVTDVPVLQPIPDMTVVEGDSVSQQATASDAGGSLQTQFSLSGPGFLRMDSPSRLGGQAAVRLTAAPGYSDAGTYTATLTATNGIATATQSFGITVTEGNQPPIVAEDLGTIRVLPGTLASVDVPAMDPEGAPLTFSKSYGPAYMTVLTVDPGPGAALGRVELRPTVADYASIAWVKVSDGTKSSYAHLYIDVPDLSEINAPPVLHPVADMIAAAGDSAFQIVTATDPDGNTLAFAPINFLPYMALQTISRGPTGASARIVLAPRATDRMRAQVGIQVSDGLAVTQQAFYVTVVEPHAGSTMLQLHREPASADGWETLEFRAGEGAFSAGGNGGTVAITFDPPEPPPNGTAWGPTVQLACLPAQRPVCVSERINFWTLWFQPPLGRTFTPGIYPAKPVADSTNAAFVASAWCWRVAPPISTVEIRQVEYGAGGVVTAFWATARHDPDASMGLFTAEVRYNARLPVSIDAPSRMEAHATIPLEVPLRIGGFAPGTPSVTSPDLPSGAAITVTSDSNAVFRWTPAFDQKGLYALRFIAERPGYAADTCLMTTCVDIPGEVTARLDANRIEPVVTNRGVTHDLPADGPGVFYPTGSAVPAANTVGLVLGGVVDGAVRIAMPAPSSDYHAGPIQNGAAVPFDPRFKNWKIRKNGTADYDWLHWPTDLGAPLDANGAPLLTGDQTIWSLYNDAPAPWETAARQGLGVEVRQTTSGKASLDAFGDAAYQTFHVKNAGTSGIHGLYAGIYVDPVTWDGFEVLYRRHGAMACDTTLNLAYAYDAYDGFYTPNVVGVVLLSPRDLAAVQNQRWSYPASNVEGQIYAELQGLNPDGTPRHERDDPSLPVTPYAYTGDPLTKSGWLYPYDAVSFVLSAGPFDLLPGDEREVTIALVGAKGYDRFDAIRRLRERAAVLLGPPPPPSDRAPVAEAGGPYSGFAGSPIQLDGSRSSDPDGDALTYTWRFGDGAIGNGAQPLHTYVSAGTYGVRLSVFDATMGAEDTTSAQVAPVDSALASLTASGPAVRLQSSRPTFPISLEPSDGTFTASDVLVATVTLERKDRKAPAITALDKSPAPEDADHDGVREVVVAFRNTDLRAMLADLPAGKTEVAFWVRGNIMGGGRFAAPLELTVDSGRGGLGVSVAPNPLNPSAVLTFRTTRAGEARVLLFDVRGRLVRTALEDRALPAGWHDVPIGRDDRGRDLASGIYFYRVVAGEGESSGKIAVMK